VNQVSSPRNRKRISITESGFDEIAKAGRIKLDHHLRSEIEEVLNSYVLRSGWDRDSRPSKGKNAHLQSLKKQVNGLLRTLHDVNRKLTDGTDFDPGIALEDQCLFHRAGVDPIKLHSELHSLAAAFENDQVELNKGGRPKDEFLSQFFCELEEIYLNAGGTGIGVTKTLDGARKCPFADFVSAILRFAPQGIGPSSSLAVPVAWERQLRSRKIPTNHN